MGTYVREIEITAHWKVGVQATITSHRPLIEIRPHEDRNPVETCVQRSKSNAHWKGGYIVRLLPATTPIEIGPHGDRNLVETCVQDRNLCTLVGGGTFLAHIHSPSAPCCYQPQSTDRNQAPRDRNHVGTYVCGNRNDRTLEGRGTGHYYQN